MQMDAGIPCGMFSVEKKELLIGYAPTGRFTYPKTNSKEDIQAAKDMMFHEIAVTEWEWSMTWWSDPDKWGMYWKIVMNTVIDA